MNQRYINHERRRLLLAGLGLGGLALAGGWHYLQRPPTSKNGCWLSASSDAADHHSLTWPLANGHRAVRAPSDFRGHWIMQHPQQRQRVFMIGRRPAAYGLEANLESGEIVRRFQCEPGRHFEGHACFNSDGSILFTAESDYENGVGKIGIRDGSSLRWLGEIDSGGVGPHEIALMPDQKTLAVANGGLRMHPDRGREILNLDTMDSSLVYLNPGNGEILNQIRVPETKASIRHFDIAPDGTVAFAMQLQRPADDDSGVIPLAGLHRPHQSQPELLADPEPLIMRMNGYMGSVVINPTSGIAGFTSPRGNIAAFWRIEDGSFAGYHRFHDVCGITCIDDEFLLSSSNGEVRFLHGSELAEQISKRQTFHGIHWDNHMVPLV